MHPFLLLILNEFYMKTQSTYLVILCGVILLFSNCGKPTLPCGTFTFTGTALPQGGGSTANVSFNFDPSVCSSTCNCNTICYVQIVRVIDETTGNFLAPNSDQQNRIVTGRPEATLNGWAVDRLAGRNWGYYGRDNDGSFSGITSGSNSSAAVLFDMPNGWGANDWLDFVSVPVCIQDGSACVNNLLGYYYWLIIIGNDGHNGNPFNEIGVDWNKDSFDAAVTEWNTDAPGLSKTSFPAFTRMAE
jgi:hypothetical protein